MLVFRFRRSMLLSAMYLTSLSSPVRSNPREILNGSRIRLPTCLQNGSRTFLFLAQVESGVLGDNTEHRNLQSVSLDSLGRCATVDPMKMS